MIKLSRWEVIASLVCMFLTGWLFGAYVTPVGL